MSLSEADALRILKRWGLPEEYATVDSEDDSGQQIGAAALWHPRRISVRKFDSTSVSERGVATVIPLAAGLEPE